MDIQPSVLNRLIAARYLIDSSGQELTAISDPLIVCQKILTAHDAAELVFIALLSQLGLQAPEKDGKIKQEPSFMAMTRAVLKEAAKNQEIADSRHNKLFEDLNHARVSFKHHGLLVDASTNFHLFADVVQLLDVLCNCLINRGLLSIDHSAAISSEDIRANFQSARESIDAGDFRLALEKTALGLAVAFWEMNVPSSLTAGKASSEDALLLSGRGIDAASFLSMQKLLPICYYLEEKTEWELRRYGHEGNWTCENAEFCLQTAITTIVRLQSAPSQPLALDFYDLYEDVIEVLVASPEVFLTRGFAFSTFQNERQVDVFRKGDVISGRAKGRVGKDKDSESAPEVGLEYADWVSVERPSTDKLERSSNPWDIDLLWFKKEEIDVSYRLDQTRDKIRRAFTDSVEKGIPSDGT
ncbi:MAG TPA: hypothetical protein VII95_02095 [Terriglobales bacterium]|jgi:hypothetical protein